MTDRIHLEQRGEPWKPTEESELAQILHEFSIPLVGVIAQHGVKYLFWCVVGHAASTNAWAYALVDDATIAKLDETDEDTFEDALRSAVGDDAHAYALATERAGIREFVYLEPGATFEDVYATAMPLLFNKLDETQAELRELHDRWDSVLGFRMAPTRAMADVLVDGVSA